MKKLFITFSMCFCMAMLFVLPAKAATTERPVVVLGADLSADQRAYVLNEMGLTEADLQNCVVLTITNEMEHQYLDQYMDPAVIGKRALSSVLLTKNEPGHGVLVTTKNINYCTTGMYRNALLTAGLEDTDVFVVGPSPISGTAALIGAVKAYEDISGDKVSDKVLDTAVDELITTGEMVNMDGVKGEDVEALIAYIKAKLAAGELETEDDIRKAITEGEEKFGVTLTQENRDKIVSVMQKINAIGLDPNQLLDQAQDLYKKFGNDIFKHTEEIIKDSVEKTFKNYITDVKNKVVEFFTGIFKRS
ncbi:MAG: DUF1002 domain-containing protein [Lachnospiraceae bacterium]|nr:DUF1002 domain-containing protein [Lachnospiraceae bacterium]